MLSDLNYIKVKLIWIFVFTSSFLLQKRFPDQAEYAELNTYMNHILQCPVSPVPPFLKYRTLNVKLKSQKPGKEFVHRIF